MSKQLYLNGEQIMVTLGSMCGDASSFLTLDLTVLHGTWAEARSLRLNPISNGLILLTQCSKLMSNVDEWLQVHKHE